MWYAPCRAERPLDTGPQRAPAETDVSITGSAVAPHLRQHRPFGGIAFGEVWCPATDGCADSVRTDTRISSDASRNTTRGVICLVANRCGPTPDLQVKPRTDVHHHGQLGDARVTTAQVDHWAISSAAGCPRRTSPDLEHLGGRARPARTAGDQATSMPPSVRPATRRPAAPRSRDPLLALRPSYPAPVIPMPWFDHRRWRGAPDSAGTPSASSTPLPWTYRCPAPR
jgi:hypothetical protein